MSRIFLSHASRDNREALALKKWLAEQRPELANEIFLDIDPDTGLQVGARWKGQLFESTSRCEAVICLLSASWEASHECRTEYRFAEGLGKQILIARLEDTSDSDITAEWQRCDLFADGSHTEVAVPGEAPVRFNTAALYRLRKAIEGSGIGPHNFVWPPADQPGRAPFRGWEPFQATDAGVFFGRDTAIVGGLDELRGMRFRLLATLSEQKSLFVVLGPSGSGKSSFLRAGLIPRLQREDRRFVVLGVLRPEHNPLTGEHGLAAAIAAGRGAVGLTDPPLGEIKNALGDPETVCQLLADIRAAASRRLLDAGHHDGEGRRADNSTPASDAGEEGGAPTMVLPLDQAEELFSADAGAQADQFLTLLAELLRRLNTADIGLIVAASIRTDRFEALQSHPALDAVGTVLFDNLKPMPPTQFETVITGPAARATEAGHRLEVAPDLVTALLADAAEGADTLPLLALTLDRLYGDYASTGRLTLAHYREIGGIRQVVQSTIDEVLSPDQNQLADQVKLLRAAFIPWLATINPDNDQPLRRVARYSDLPEQSHPLIDALVEKRLLVRDTRDGHVVIEVALESLLRQWDSLAGWLRAERQNLKTADDIERNAAFWAGRNRDPAWLLAGTRLTDAETLVNTPGFADRLSNVRDYLAASRAAENQRRAAEENQHQAELRYAEEQARYAQERQHTAETHARAMRPRARILSAVAILAVIAAVAAVVGFVQSNAEKQQAQASAKQAIGLRLVSDAGDLLAGRRSGGDIPALQELLAADALAGPAAGAGMLNAAIDRRTTVKIIDARTAVNAVAFSGDGHRLAWAGDDDTVRILDAETGQLLSTLTGHIASVSSVAFSPDGHHLASGSSDSTVRIWDTGTGQLLSTLTGHTSGVTSVAFNPDGHELASASSDKTVRLWNTDTGQPLGAPLTGHTDWVRSVAFSPDGHRLASASDDQTVRVWDTDTGQPLGAPLTGHTGYVFSVAFSPDGHRLASASSDKTLRIWDTDTGQPIGGPLTGHTDTVDSVAFSPDRHDLASASSDNTVRIWSIDGQLLSTLTGHTSGVTSVAFSPDGHHLASGSADTTVRKWNIDAGAPLTGHTNTVSSVAFSPDGNLASGSTDDTVRLWSGDTRPYLATLVTAATSGVTSVAFSPDGHRLASAGDDHTVRIWDAKTGQPLSTLTHTSGVTNVAFSPEGHRLAAASSDKTVRIWNIDTGQLLSTLTGHRESVTSVAFNPDGHHLASASYDKTVRLWNTDTGQPLGAPLTGHTSGVTSVAFGPDGHHLASASGDKTVRLWNTDTGRLLSTLTGHTSTVNSVAFSPDGHHLASASNDNTVRLWSLNGDVAQPFGAPLTPVTTSSDSTGMTSVAFSLDGHRLAAGNNDDTVYLWPAEATLAMLCTKLTTNMSQQQWHDWVAPDIGYHTQCPDLPVPPDNGQPPPAPGQAQLPFTGLNHPVAITVDHSGTVYVADTDNNRVLRLPSGAAHPTTVMSGLSHPDGVAVDSAGTLYVADARNHRILKLPAGVKNPIVLLDGLNQPSDVTVDSTGTLYIADYGNKQVLQLPPGATHPTALPLSDSGAPGALAIDTKRTVYVTMDDEKVVALPVGATHSSAVPLPGLSSIGAVAVDTAGNIYATGYLTNNVVELPKGSPAPTELPFSGLNQPVGLTVDSNGNLYVVDTGNNRVLMRHVG